MAVRGDHIGIQVRHWRLNRSLSQRQLAGSPVSSQGYIAQIEAGTKAVDKRSVQVALAGALPRAGRHDNRCCRWRPALGVMRPGRCVCGG